MTEQEKQENTVVYEAGNVALSSSLSRNFRGVNFEDIASSSILGYHGTINSHLATFFVT